MWKALTALNSGIWGQIFHRNETLMMAARGVVCPPPHGDTCSWLCVVQEGQQEGPMTGLANLFFKESSEGHNQSSAYRKETAYVIS